MYDIRSIFKCYPLKKFDDIFMVDNCSVVPCKFVSYYGCDSKLENLIKMFKKNKKHFKKINDIYVFFSFL